jgi:tRNA U34 5-methylaminomethyl-2-thiouridine-forming methyltransferase MnmC
MARKLIETGDGSHTLYVEELDERYHSYHGAIQESKHVFIKSGLHYIIEKQPALAPVAILEIGLGTGLNALLTLIEADVLNKKIEYTAIEAHPLEKSIVDALNYVSLLNAQHYQTYFDKMHESEWNTKTNLSSNFELDKMHTTLDVAVFETKYNLIYFDAFGPRVQPEMWTLAVFSKLADSLLLGGCLVTYCAKGEVKRTLKSAGFIVESIEGPPGKREMVRAIKP